MSMASIVGAIVVASGVMARTVRVIMATASIMMRVMVVVVVVPNMDSIASIFVAPLYFCLEMGTLSMLITFNGMIWVPSTVTKLPSVRVRNASISVKISIKW